MEPFESARFVQKIIAIHSIKFKFFYTFLFTRRTLVKRIFSFKTHLHLIYRVVALGLHDIGLWQGWRRKKREAKARIKYTHVDINNINFIRY